MADNSKNINVQTGTTKPAGTITSANGVKTDLSYDDKVVEKIVGIATQEIPGVLAMTGGFIGNLNTKLHVTNQQTTGIDAEVGKKQVALDLNVVCEYGKYVPELFDTIVQKVSKAVKDMTGLDVIEVNMHVQDVVDSQEFQKLQQQQQQSLRENFGMGQQQDPRKAAQAQQQYNAGQEYTARVQ